MQEVKQALLGPGTLTYRQTCLALTLCAAYILYIPSRGFIDNISQHQETDYMSNYFICYGIAYIFGSIFNAMIIDKIGAKLNMILLGIMLSFSIFTFSAIVDSKPGNHYFLFGINAIASSGIFPTIAKFIYTYYYPAQYDIMFIMIGFGGSIFSFSTTFGIDKLIKLSSNSLLIIGFITLLGVVVVVILSAFIEKNKDAKWHLSPMSVYDHILHTFDETFTQKQILLNMIESELAKHKKNAPNTDRNKNDESFTISDASDVPLTLNSDGTDVVNNNIENENKEIDDDNTISSDFEHKTLKTEIEEFIKNKPKYILDIPFLKTYFSIVIAMICLSLMNCLNVFSLSLLDELLPNIESFKFHKSKYDSLSLNSVPLMLQIGIIIALTLSLFYRYFYSSSDAVYGDFKCSTLLIKLLVLISFVLCLFIWFIDGFKIVDPGTTPMCLYLFDFLFILFGLCIAYPIHVFCFVFLLTICHQHNVGFYFCILDLFIFIINWMFAISGKVISIQCGYQWIGLLFAIYALCTNFFYQHLSDVREYLQLTQNAKLLNIMQKFDLLSKTKYVPYTDIDSSNQSEDTLNDDYDDDEYESSSYDDHTDELYSTILLHFKHISIQIKAMRQSQHLRNTFSGTYSVKERISSISGSYDELMQLLKELKQISPKWYNNLKSNWEILPYVKQIVKLEQMNEFQQLYTKKQLFFIRFINSMN